MKEVFYIYGMSCSACSSGIEVALRRKNGIREVKVDLLNYCAIVDFDETLISLKEIFDFIVKLGYTPQKQGLIEKIDSTFLTPKRRILITLFFTLIVLYLAMMPMLSPYLVPLSPPLNAYFQLICAFVVMHMGRDFYFKGFKALFTLHPTMDSLVALGSGSAFVYSFFSLVSNKYHLLYFESICVIILFILLGKVIEEKAKNSTQNSLLSLASLKEAFVIRINGEQEEQIPIDYIMVGDTLKITPQSIIPTEGILTRGYANLDLSSLNGESLPICKKEGENITSGALNLNTTFLMRTTQTPQNSTYWKILDLVQNTLLSKPPIAKFADTISLYFVPSVIVLAFLSSGAWFVFMQNFDFAFGIFCSILLISCPCALGLATPLALNIASNLASKRGIFFKDAQILELVGKTQVVFFDKTGTLTHKELQIDEIASFSSLSQEELLCLCASLEAQSHHIIAQSILAYAQKLKIPLLQVTEIFIKEGFGISGMIGQERYKIGNAKSFTPPPIHAFTNTLNVFIGKETKDGDEILGCIGLKEFVRREAKACIQNLRTYKINPVLLSGDSQNNVQQIAKELKMDFIANALPQDKLETIKKHGNKITMMIGDGINDMLALSHADISVSVGEGNQGAIASANLIILNNDLLNIPYSIALSQATLKNIKQNLCWAFGYNTLMIPLACGALARFDILLNPMFASLAMTLSSLSVVFNAQRLKKFKG